MGSRPGRQRYCRCGTHLAADNTERQCARCQRAARDKLIAPPVVPAWFWETEQFREAFAAQHIGRVVRAFRMSPYHHTIYGPGGISQGLLGQWIGLKQPQISKIETGQPILNLDTLRYYSRVLCIPQERLWFDLADQKNEVSPHPDDSSGHVVLSSGHAMSQACTGLTASLDAFLGSSLGPLLRLAGEDGEDTMERMKRRAFMLQTAALGVGGTAAILEAVRHDLHRFLADERATAGVDEWQAIALDYGQTYLTKAPTTLLQALLVDLHGVELAMHRHPDETAQRKLLQAGALLAAFTAQTVANLGDLVEAQRWWRTARQAADEAADPYTMFWIRGREIVHAGYERRPVSAILGSSTRLEHASTGYHQRRCRNSFRARRRLWRSRDDTVTPSRPCTRCARASANSQLPPLTEIRYLISPRRICVSPRASFTRTWGISRKPTRRSRRH